MIFSAIHCKAIALAVFILQLFLFGYDVPNFISNLIV